MINCFLLHVSLDIDDLDVLYLYLLETMTWGVSIPLTALYQIEFVDGCFVFISTKNFDLGVTIPLTVLYQIEFVDLYYRAAYFSIC